MRGGGTAVLVTTAVSAVITFAIALVPQVHFAYWHPLLHVALETAASLIALLASILVAGRLRRRSQLNELLLGCALIVLTLLNLVFLTVTAVVRQAPHELVIGTALAGSSLGAAFFALAAFAPPRRLRRPGLALAAGTAGVTVVLLAVAVTAGLPHQRSALLAVSASPPDLQGQPTVLVLELFMTLLYGAAAAGFLRRSRQPGDEFSGWLAIAAILAAASHLNYFLYPALYSAWVHIGDVFRLCFYAALLAGSMREIWSYWQGLPEAAVLRERQRIARDLHDGLAQELAYLARNLDAPTLEPGSDAQRRLRRAAERAQSVGGEVRISSAPGQGSQVEVAL
jgi:signal transduction histidine kinase